MPHGLSDIDRIDWHADKSGECWLWTGTIALNGYGLIYRQGGPLVGAHRLAYEVHVGPIPKGYELDHLCRVRRCVNPAHLEPVTHSENVRRGFEARNSST